LLLALFRVIEPISGSIYIDSVDITQVGLYDRELFIILFRFFLLNILVRSILAVVPQSADLFEGTLRENIDPVGLYSDIDIWDTLAQVCCIFVYVYHYLLNFQVNLKGFVESLPDKLDTIVQEAGLSLSGGQCQLLCFARALVQKVSISYSQFKLSVFTAIKQK
jgi:ABC-type multidrug transport system fused ATPase/permease subunit